MAYPYDQTSVPRDDAEARELLRKHALHPDDAWSLAALRGVEVLRAAIKMIDGRRPDVAVTLLKMEVERRKRFALVETVTQRNDRGGFTTMAFAARFRMVDGSLPIWTIELTPAELQRLEPEFIARELARNLGHLIAEKIAPDIMAVVGPAIEEAR